MNTKALAAIGVLLAVVTLGFASTEKAVDRPPGIAIDQWFPISDHLGLVVSDYQPELDPLIDNGPVEVPPVPRTPSAPIITQQTAELLRLLDGPRNPVDATHPGSITPALAGYLMIARFACGTPTRDGRGLPVVAGHIGQLAGQIAVLRNKIELVAGARFRIITTELLVQPRTR